MEKLDWQSTGGYPGGCTGFDGGNTARSAGDYGYFEQNITLQNEKLRDDIATFSFNYNSDWFVSFNASLFMSIIIGNIEINHFVYIPDIPLDTWVTSSMNYNPITYGQVLPGVVTIRVGLIMNEDSSPGWVKIYLDNIKCEIWSESNEMGIIRVFDHQFFQNYTYYNTTFGKGYSFIDAERTPDSDHQIDFTIYNNRSGISDFYINKITLISHAIKKFNSTVSNKLGSLYSLGDNISWQVEFSIILHNNYDCWVILEKPSDWEFIHAIDGFQNEKIDFCLGKTLGSILMIIPLAHTSEGLWKLEAISKNYIEKGNIGVWDGFQFISATKLTHGDIFFVNISLDDSITLSNSEINYTIYYPNASVFWQDNKEPTSYNEKFGNFRVGKNMTVGNYLVTVEWINNPSYEELDEVGYIELAFFVWHHTNLTTVDSYIEKIAGDPCLIKVNYMDYDFGTNIAFATVIYNSTFGQSGSMVYLGSGTYFLDLDTSGLGLGDYYFSFNASKTFYQPQMSNDLIHLRIISQPLALEVPNTVISGSGNDYISCQVNVTGAFSGTLMWPANITTNWQNPYTVIDHYNGTYTLNFSTWNLPTQGIIETFTVSIFASKTYHGNATSFIAITVYPIETNIGVNRSIFVVDLGEKFDIKVNYTVEGSESLILGANCSFNWPSLYNITVDAQGFVVRADTVNLSIETYTAIIKLEKPGFETAYKSITVIINRIDIEVNTIDFQDSLEVFLGDTVIIEITLTESGTEIYIENATVFYSWEFGLGYFDYVSNGIYELELIIPNTIEGNHKMTLIILKEDSIYNSKEFSFLISINAIEQPNYLIWFILYSLLIGISLLGILSLRTYVILPHKRKKESDLQAKTQKYRDVMNVEAIVLSNQVSGLQIYSKSYYLFKERQSQLLSGFIQAITLVSNEIIGKENVEKIAIKPEHPKGIEKIVELDFKHFNFFICDYKDIRLISILKEKASKRFKDQTARLLMEIDLHFSDQLANWDGNLETFENILPPLLDQHFQLYYRDKFKLNNIKNINQMKKEGGLSKLELRLLNVITSMTKHNEEFYLQDAIENIHEKNKDKVIKALELLIERKVVIPSKQ